MAEASGQPDQSPSANSEQADQLVTKSDISVEEKDHLGNPQTQHAENMEQNVSEEKKDNSSSAVDQDKIRTGNTRPKRTMRRAKKTDRFKAKDKKNSPEDGETPVAAKVYQETSMAPPDTSSKQSSEASVNGNGKEKPAIEEPVTPSEQTTPVAQTHQSAKPKRGWWQR